MAVHTEKPDEDHDDDEGEDEDDEDDEGDEEEDEEEEEEDEDEEDEDDSRLEHGLNIWVWLRIKRSEGQTAGFGPCFHLPRVPFWNSGFLSHSHM